MTAGLSALGLGAVALMLACGAAEAHPHVWVTSKSEIVYAPDGTVTGVRHAWTFDDMFSTYATQGLPQATKGVFTREELADLAKTNVESLKEFDFFTFAKTGPDKQRFNEPVDYYLEFKDNVLTLHFTLPFKTPVKTKALSLEIFDPTYFVDFAFAEQDAAKLVGAPATCKLAFQRPNPNNPATQKLTEQMFQSGDNSNYGAAFANKLEVTCP
jgi:ABC-type uncharacterized transport system substrate-binding protein